MKPIALSIMKSFNKIILVLFAILISTTLIQLPAFGAAPSTLEVLEVQPGSSTDLTATTLITIFNGRTVHLTQMSMPEFISKVDEINGKYDIVYIGNNGASYTALGTAPRWLPVCLRPTKNYPDSQATSMEYYSDNDITNRRADTLKKFIDSKQLTIFDSSILGTTLGTKLKAKFNSYVTSNPNNFKTVDRSSLESSLREAFSAYNNANVGKRPVLSLSSQPEPYGQNRSYSTLDYFGYAYNISNLNKADMNVELYIDINGDGMFNNSEMVHKEDYHSASVSSNINYPLPDSFIGLQPWKLEVTDESTGAKSYTLGNTAVKATTNAGALKVRVLQLQPNNNTLSIYSLHNIKDPNTNQIVDLLSEARVYNIDITEMSVADFNTAYATNQSPQPASATVNGVSIIKVPGKDIKVTAPTVLNGNYDMVIMGFADSYGSNDLNAKAIQALQSFIDTNQSVMFTHDTMQYHPDIDANNFPGTYNLTKSFRKLVGQQRYYHTDERLDPTNRTYDPMPDPKKDSYGYTNRLFDRFKNNGIREGLDTTTKTYKVNENLVTQFPFVLADIPVATTHYQWYQLDLEDPNVVPVYTLYDKAVYNNRGDGRNDYYTYTKGNITYSGTGHSNVSADNSIEEEKMFVNTMLKASRGANHAPTLVVNGISNNMNISNTLPSIDFSFTATDIDLNDKVLKADIYLSISMDGTTFIDPPTSTLHLDSVTSGVAKAVNLLTVNSSIKAYKVKVIVYDSYHAQVSQEIVLNSVNEPSINVTSLHAPACLVGDTIAIPVNLAAQRTGVKVDFTNIILDGVLIDPNDNRTNAYHYICDENLHFMPDPSWISSKTQTYPVTFGTQGNPNSAGTYIISNQLSYKVLNKSVQPNPTTSSVIVYSGTIGVYVSDQNDGPVVPLKLVKDSDGSVLTGTTTASEYYAFTGLGSGSYTVTIPGRVDIPSQKVILSVTDYDKEITFQQGHLMTEPSITATSGNSQMVINKNKPFNVRIGLTLNRDANSLQLGLLNSLSGNLMEVGITKVTYRMNPEADPVEINISGVEVQNSNSGTDKIINLTPRSDFFPIGLYTLEATITINGGTTQASQSFSVSLTQQTSAQDTHGVVESIYSVPPSLSVGSSPKLH